MGRRRLLIAVSMYATVALLAYALTDSTVLFAVFAGGTIALLDAFLFRLIAGQDDLSALRTKIVYCLCGASLALLLLLAGTISTREAFYLGCLGGLTGALLHSSALVLARRHPAVRLVLGVVFAVALLSLAPVFTTLHPIHKKLTSTPGHLGLEYEDVSFAAKDGQQIKGWYIPADNPVGVVIFCHGHGENRGQVLGMLPTLSDLRFDVLAFDFRGHGESEGHTATFGHLEVADLIAARQFVAQRSPGHPVCIVGISYGAAVTLQALPQLSDVQAVWLEAAFARFSAVAEHRFAHVPAGIRSRLLACYFAIAHLDCGVSPEEINPIDQLHKINLPIMFVHGRQDELIPFTQGELLYETYGGSKQYFWVEGANHFNLFYVCRDEYLSRLSAFLRRSFERARRESVIETPP